MPIGIEGQVSSDYIRPQGFYLGKKSGRKIRVTSVGNGVVRYRYVYEDGSPMTTEQIVSREKFARMFVTQGSRAQEK